MFIILAPCFIELLMFYSKMYSMFYVNDEPEGKFSTQRQYSYIVLYCNQRPKDVIDKHANED